MIAFHAISKYRQYVSFVSSQSTRITDRRPDRITTPKTALTLLRRAAKGNRMISRTAQNQTLRTNAIKVKIDTEVT